jgi:DNA transformation protein and related proteins
MTAIDQLPNIGPVLAESLKIIGVTDQASLARMGSVQAIINLENAGQDTCCSKLYALEGAIRGVRWHDLPEELRKQLKADLKKAHQS